MNERTLFTTALEIDDPTQRRAFLDEACAGDAALRQRVEALLGSHEREGPFLDVPAVEQLAGSAVTQAEALPAADEAPSLRFLAPSDKPNALGRLAHYEVQELIGYGGMGIVLRAFDEQLHRVVAIKVMAAQLATSATARKRFKREAQAAAAVSHDHIVTIHAVEDAGERPYLVMQYVGGLSLQERLERDGPLQLHEILRIGIQTASGLAAAHAQGLVHRDVKPANILLENSVQRVKITDFGLARAACEVSETQSGLVAGTPQYMSPEQAEGKAMDQRSDLFSLGSVLYAMCTGRAPFRASETMAVLKRVCEQSPSPIRDTNPEIPEWLVAIIDKLHAKDPAERFQSANEVADLLSRYLALVQQPSGADGRLPIAEWEGKPLRPGKTARRCRSAVLRPSSALAAAVAVLVLLFAGLGLTEATGVTNLRTTVIHIFTADGTLVVETDDPAVKLTVEGDGGLVIRGAGPEEIRLRPGSYRVRAAKDGKPVPLDRELITISRGGKQVVKVRMEAAGAAATDELAVGEVRRHRWYGRHTYATAFSPDSRYYAATGSVQPQNTARVWDVVTGEVVMEVSANECVVFTPDAKQLFTAGPDMQLHVWEVPTGKELRRFGRHPTWVDELNLSPDGKRLISSCNDGILRLWDAATGEAVTRLNHGANACMGFFSPDSRQILSVSNYRDGMIRLWDAADGKQLREWKHDSKTWWAQFAPDGRHFTTFADDKVYFWDSAGDEQPQTLQLRAGVMQALGISLDGRRMLYSLKGNTAVHLVELPGGKELKSFEVPETAYGQMSISPDGRFGVGASGGGWVYLWRLPDPPATGKSSANVEPGAFVVLGGAGGAEQKFDTLADAVLGASAGDTIEIRGNGPFVSEPVDIQRTALTIRAGEGFRPVIKLSPEAVPRQYPLLKTHAALVLEGLELQRAPGTPRRPGQDIIDVHQAPFRAANCRFRGSVHSNDVPVCMLRNCEFLAEAIEASVCGQHCTKAQFIFENCIHRTSGNAITLAYHDAALDAVSIQIKRGTFANRYVAIGLPLRFPLPADSDGQQSAQPFQCEVSGCIFDAPSVLRFMQTRAYLDQAAVLDPAQAEATLLRLFGWRGERNLFAAGSTSMFWWVEDVQQPPHGPANLEDWKRFWGTAEADSLEGRVRFQGGNLLARTEATLDQLTPDDFRLRADSAGYRAGPDGKDLGADVDLVGPGEAYERWKKTPDYEQWLEVSGQVER